MYNGTNTLFIASYVGVDLIVLIKKLLDMGNSRNRARKTRINMPIEKENEVKEKAMLEMERVRDGPDISTDTVTDPNRFDDITTSTSEPQVKRLPPMNPTQVPTSKQSPTNNPSTSHVEALDHIGVLRDAEYEALDLGAMINLQSLPEDHNHVEHIPNMDRHVNDSPQQRSPGIRRSCRPSLP